jgi:hypothetical protein
MSNTQNKEWTDADERFLRRLVAAMRPIERIVAEFPDHDANDVRDALEQVFINADQPPAEHALDILGPRAGVRRRSPVGFSLDGRPVGVAQLVDDANRVLLAFGQPTIPYPAVVHK